MTSHERESERRVRLTGQSLAASVACLWSAAAKLSSRVCDRHPRWLTDNVPEDSPVSVAASRSRCGDAGGLSVWSTSFLMLMLEQSMQLRWTICGGGDVACGGGVLLAVHNPVERVGALLEVLATHTNDQSSPSRGLLRDHARRIDH